MELFAVHLVRPPEPVSEAENGIAGLIARTLAPRQRRAKKDRWADLSRKRLGVVRITPPKP